MTDTRDESTSHREEQLEIMNELRNSAPEWPTWVYDVLYADYNEQYVLTEGHTQLRTGLAKVTGLLIQHLPQSYDRRMPVQTLIELVTDDVPDVQNTVINTVSEIVLNPDVEGGIVLSLTPLFHHLYLISLDNMRPEAVQKTAAATIIGVATRLSVEFGDVVMGLYRGQLSDDIVDDVEDQLHNLRNE